MNKLNKRAKTVEVCKLIDAWPWYFVIDKQIENALQLEQQLLDYFGIQYTNIFTFN